MNYIFRVYRKSNSSKNRAKIFDILASYIGVTGDILFKYSEGLYLETNRQQTKFNNKISSTSSTTPNSNTTTSYPSGTTTSKKISNNNNNNNNKPSSPVHQAINLSTSSQSSFSEGLAGKLMVNNAAENLTSNNNSNKNSSYRNNPISSANNSKTGITSKSSVCCLIKVLINFNFLEFSLE